MYFFLLLNIIWNDIRGHAGLMGPPECLFSWVIWGPHLSPLHFWRADTFDKGYEGAKGREQNLIYNFPDFHVSCQAKPSHDKGNIAPWPPMSGGGQNQNPLGLNVDSLKLWETPSVETASFQENSSWILLVFLYILMLQLWVPMQSKSLLTSLHSRKKGTG